jgi:prepilin-type N-terminal cleavage/methylation domain-containing protein
MKHQGQQGFTLTEAMIASVILLLVFASMLALAGQGFRYMSDLRRWARSSQVLQQKMEDIRLITQWSTMQALNNTTFTDNSIPGQPISARISIGSYNPPYPTNIMALVTITATWTNSGRRVVSNSLNSAVCQNGLNKYIF